MRNATGTFRSLSNPLVLLRLNLIAIGLTVLLIVAVTAVHTSRTNSEARRAESDARAAQVASQGQVRIHEIMGLLGERTEAFLDSPEVAALNDSQRAALTRELRRRDHDPPEPGLPDVQIALSMQDAIAMQTLLNEVGAASRPAILDAPPDIQAAARALSEAGATALQAYLTQPSPTNLRLLMTHFTDVQNYLAAQTPALLEGADQHREQLREQTSTSRLAIFGTTAVLGALILLIGFYMSRRIRATLEAVESNAQAVSAVSSSLRYRNDQLNALYNVFSEITESLSLRYVVASTVEQSLRVMNADVVVLRLLRSGELVVAGAVTAEGTSIEDLPPVALGEGPAGRAARRGRSIHVPSGAQELLADIGEGADGVESGIVVPLIVGARVVGTLACWSRNEGAFGEEDERILEMLASQVATAIVAADTTETSERQAMIDPLTNLPNRRQLDRDLQGELKALLGSGRHAVFAMADIDHFKRLNDDHGHKVGDVTLQKVAAIMRMAVRQNDRVYRYGGEEFLIVFMDSEPGEEEALANRVREALEAAPFSGEAMQPVGPVTISMGLARLPQDSEDTGLLIQMADRAMYASKDAGRNRVTLWSNMREGERQTRNGNAPRRREAQDPAA